MSINAVYEDSQGNVHESRMDGVDLTTKISIADDFSAMVNYAVGDFCYHLGTLYKCTTAHTAGAWNAAHFTATQVGDELGELKNTLTSVEDALDEVKNNSWVVLNDNVKYRVSGGFVYIIAKLSNTNGSWASLGTMPKGLRPSNNVYNCCLYTMSPTASYANLYCNSQGSIQQFANATANNGFLLYPIEQ